MPGLAVHLCARMEYGGRLRLQGIRISPFNRPPPQSTQAFSLGKAPEPVNPWPPSNSPPAYTLSGTFPLPENLSLPICQMEPREWSLCSRLSGEPCGGRDCEGLVEQDAEPLRDPRRSQVPKATVRPLTMSVHADPGRALVIRPGKGRVPPSALSLRIQGPFFSGKQATFITSDSQALMQSGLEP